MNKDTPALTQPPASSRPAAEANESAPTDAGAAPPLHGAGTQEQASPGARSGIANWALLLAVLGLAGAGWSGWQVATMRAQATELRSELAARLDEGSAIALEARGVSRQQHETLNALEGKVAVLGAKVEATEGQAEALEELYRVFSQSREQGVVAEAEQAMAIAAQQLQLAGNVETALVALQTADARLASQDRGQLTPLRRALARDIENLKLQKVVDVPGIALRLEQLLAGSDALPLAFERELEARAQARAEQEQAPAEESYVDAAMRLSGALARDVWSEITGLLRVERLDNEPVLLAPEQNFYLRESLKVRLLTARLALLARDGRTYGADLAQAQEMIEKFFDGGDARVRAALDELVALKKLDVAPEMPTLTESFAALRLLQSRNGDNGAGAAAPEEAPAAETSTRSADEPAATGSEPVAPEEEAIEAVPQPGEEVAPGPAESAAGEGDAAAPEEADTGADAPAAQDPAAAGPDSTPEPAAQPSTPAEPVTDSEPEAADAAAAR
ncbi:uroporphyrinogen-III C-methyltransferase [Thauera phenolivorans]|uniref:uroporphyrinogen-III C-methyltransferase n=1 Tax=Thauera phenolivorans TaxID=1792543 RepID=UPI0009F38BEB|nr:uroporphyrinogen-III C-methyltransferase [Thauera phenolivorans]